MKHFIKDMGMRIHTILCLLLPLSIILFSCEDSSVGKPGDSGGGANDAPLTKFTASTTNTAQDFFGRSTAISKDGNTMAVGAPFTTKETSASSSTLKEGYFAGHREAGSVYVFSKATNNEWTQQAHLEGAGFVAQFGTSVALSSNGSVLAVGAPGEAKVYIYTRTGTQWTQAKVIEGASNTGARW